MGRPPGSKNRHGRAHPITPRAVRQRYQELTSGIADRLRELCEEQDISLIELARAAGYHQDSCFRWVRTRQAPRSIHTLLTLALVLRAPLVDLLPFRAHLP